ncbi:MAG: DUF58 domain-containing protein [Cyanobacteria bacterium J06641_5]
MIGLCFFGAATNTMVGWLYALSGAMLALLAIAAILPRWSLRFLAVRRRPISPVSAGDVLTLELEVTNTGKHWCGLLEIHDRVPPSLLGTPQDRKLDALSQGLEAIGPQSVRRVQLTSGAMRRGIYRWDTVDLRSGAPLGLFDSRCRSSAPARAVVYPMVLPLNQCPLLDSFGEAESEQFQPRQPDRLMTTEIVRGLRPYRSGDSLRLVHWRSSARYGELRVRELETAASGRDLIVGLDSASAWDADDFEQATIAAASIYFYAYRRQLSVRFWSAGTGELRGNRQVLEALAGVQPGESSAQAMPTLPLLWLTPNPQSFALLPAGSRWFRFGERGESTVATLLPGFNVDRQASLQAQLQQQL